MSHLTLVTPGEPHEATTEADRQIAKANAYVLRPLDFLYRGNIEMGLFYARLATVHVNIARSLIEGGK